MILNLYNDVKNSNVNKLIRIVFENIIKIILYMNINKYNLLPTKQTSKLSL